MTYPHERKKLSFTAALKVRDIRSFIGAAGFNSMASRALAVVIGFQIYRITHSALALGWLGLIEAIPAIGLVLFGGYVADHFNRHRILLITGASSVACALGLALLSGPEGTHSLAGLYAVIFLAGIARGFSDPAASAFEAQVVPQHLTVNASSWVSSVWITCSMLGPAAIGFVFDSRGARVCYFLIAGWFLLGWLCMASISKKPFTPAKRTEPIRKSIATGWKFVFRHQPLVGAMALDLFAVLFGGAIALLPIYAESILKVGARGLGLLNAAPPLGALVSTLSATKRPPMARAGRNLLAAVTGFGASILVFAFSKNFLVSMAALFMSGVFDGVSVVIRRSMLRLLSPEEMRGRIAAANWVFITASNELGAFESGMLAALIGTIPCVALGGFVTLAVVTATAWLAPELRSLRFDPHTLEQLKHDKR